MVTNPSTTSIYALIKIVSSDSMKPEIKTACRCSPQLAPTLDPLYDWSQAQAMVGGAVWTVWAGVPQSSGVKIGVLEVGENVDYELNVKMSNDVSHEVAAQLRGSDGYGDVT